MPSAKAPANAVESVHVTDPTAGGGTGAVPLETPLPAKFAAVPDTGKMRDNVPGFMLEHAVPVTDTSVFVPEVCAVPVTELSADRVSIRVRLPSRALVETHVVVWVALAVVPVMIHTPENAPEYVVGDGGEGGPGAGPGPAVGGAGAAGAAVGELPPPPAAFAAATAAPPPTAATMPPMAAADNPPLPPATAAAATPAAAALAATCAASAAVVTLVCVIVAVVV